jgi:dUTP pyrophosphatase
MAAITIKVKRFDKELPLPQRHSAGAVGYDLYARLDTTIPARGFGRIPLNVAIEVPPGCWMLLAARSSTHKYGLLPANGIGIIDHDYKGDNDEYLFLVYNLRDEAVTVTRGTRIAQMVLMAPVTLKVVEVERLTAVDRGGIGSTGSR